MLPAEGLTHLVDLATKMLGTLSSHTLKFKGAEAWGMFLFACDELNKRQGLLKPSARVLLEASIQLRRTWEITKSHGVTMPPDACQATLDA